MVSLIHIIYLHFNSLSFGLLMFKFNIGHVICEVELPKSFALNDCFNTFINLLLKL